MKKFVLLIATTSAMACDFSAGAEAVYMQPSFETFHSGQYTRSSTALPTRKYIDLNPNYGWGFRIFGEAGVQCYFASLEWLHVKQTSFFITYNVRQPVYQLQQFPYQDASAINVEVLKSRQYTRYNKVSGKFGRYFFRTNCSSVYGYAGGRWVDLWINPRSQGIDDDDVVQNDIAQVSQFNGGGVEVGIGARVDLLCGFGASVRCGLMGVVGNQDNLLTRSTLDVVSVEVENRRTQWISGFELRAGIDYTLQFKCSTLRFEFGFEENYYFGALVFRQPLVDPANTLTSGFGIGGIYFGATFGF